VYPTLAIIIPCYNVEKYVEAALNSVLEQTILPSEVIIIDDGSTDGTSDILGKYAEHKQFKILKTLNKGLGSARNLGALTANSEYLMFMDSDDTISSELIERFHDELKVRPSLDIFAFSFNAFDAKSGLELGERGHIYKDEKVGLGREILADLLIKENFHSSACAFIFKKSLINWRSNGFRRILHEDEEFTPRLFYRASSVGISTYVGYFYRVNRTYSIMSSGGVARWLKSRLGCGVALLSCIKLFFLSLSSLDKRLFHALFSRIRYLSYHAFVPFFTISVLIIFKIFGRK